jgi:hypothetical protein
MICRSGLAVVGLGHKDLFKLFARHDTTTVFKDTLSTTIADPLHSEDEDRFVIIGESIKRRILVVVHTDRGEKIRIITARVANAHERKKYEEGY